MTNTELERALRALAEAFAQGVIRAITALPLNKLAHTIEPGKRSPSSPSATAQPPKSNNAKPAPTRSTRKGAPKGTPLREEIFAILVRSKDWMTSEQIKRELSRVPSRNSVFKALQGLHDKELVSKRGSTRAMEYRVTRKGLEERG